MAIVIFKYPLPPQQEVIVPMPAGCEFLTVQVQGEVPCLWAKVDTTAEMVPRMFRWYATGQPIIDLEASESYLGTIQSFGLVFHLFVKNEAGASPPASPSPDSRS